MDGELRLVGGPSTREGRVEMCYKGVWGSISDTRWDNEDAAVTCSQLGFEPSGMYNGYDCVVLRAYAPLSCQGLTSANYTQPHSCESHFKVRSNIALTIT